MSLTAFLVVNCTVLTALAILGTYLIFKNSLAFRIAALVGSTFPVVSIALYFVGMTQSWTLYFVVCGTVVPFLLMMLVVLYRSVVRKLSEYSATLLASASQIAATSRQTATSATEQSATVTEVSATAEEISQTSSAASSTAQQVLRSAEEALRKSQQGVEASKQAMSVMEAISKVSHIVDLVADMAEQSNLLAINASIEAAKAGEYGRGFAVVANEVRSLAEQSKKATVEIRRAINSVDDGRRAIEAVDRVNRDVLASLEDCADYARQISAASSQQAAGIKQIAAAMSNVEQSGRDSAVVAQQLEGAGHALRSVSFELKSYVTGKAASQISA